MNATHLLAGLLPATFPQRRELLEAGARLDIRYGDAAADVVLALFSEARRGAGAAVDADLRATVTALVELCGTPARESRLTHAPQEASA